MRCDKAGLVISQAEQSAEQKIYVVGNGRDERFQEIRKSVEDDDDHGWMIDQWSRSLRMAATWVRFQVS